MCVWYSIPNIETLYMYQICFDSIAFRWKNNCWSHLLQFIKRSNEDLTSMWYFGTYHISANISDPLTAHASHINSGLNLHLYIYTLWMQTAKALVSLHIYKACLSSHFLTLQWVLRYQIKCAGSFDLFFVTSYNLFSLIWNIQRINRMQLYNNDHVPMWHA